MTKAKAIADQASAPIKPALDPTPINMKALAGSKVWLINVAPTTSVIQFTKYFQEAAGAAGLKATVFDGQGSVVQWNKGIDLAISDGAKAIVLDAIDAQTVSAAVQRAKKAGITIIDTFRGRPADAPPAGLYGGVAFESYAGSAAVAAYSLALTGCKADLGFIYDPAFRALAEGANGFGDTVKKLCASCTYVPITFNLGSMATELTTAVRGAITKYPNLKVVDASFDAMLPFLLPTVKASGGNVDVVAFGALPDTFALLQKGNIKATGAYYNQAIPWAWVDQIARGMSGLPRSTVGIPLRLITPENVGSQEQMFPAYTGFKSQYLKLWGLGA